MKPRTSIALVVSRLFPNAAPSDRSSRAITSDLVARVGEWTVKVKRAREVLGRAAERQAWTVLEASREESCLKWRRLPGLGEASDFETRTARYAIILGKRGEFNEEWSSTYAPGEHWPREVIEAAQALHRTGLCALAYAGDDLPALIEACNRRGVTVVDQTDGLLASFNKHATAA